MTEKRGRPLRIDREDRPDNPPAGAALDRYEASLLLMMASRVLQAYSEQDRLPPINREAPSRRSRDKDSSGAV